MSGRIAVQVYNRALIVTISGYFEEILGKQLKQQVLEHLKAGRNRLAIDFTPCNLISSLGLAAVFDLCQTVREDYLGRILLTGMNDLARKTFSYAGIFEISETAINIEVARELIAPGEPPAPSEPPATP